MRTLFLACLLGTVALSAPLAAQTPRDSLVQRRAAAGQRRAQAQHQRDSLRAEAAKRRAAAEERRTGAVHRRDSLQAEAAKRHDAAERRRDSLRAKSAPARRSGQQPQS